MARNTGSPIGRGGFPVSEATSDEGMHIVTLDGVGPRVRTYSGPSNVLELPTASLDFVGYWAGLTRPVCEYRWPREQAEIENSYKPEKARHQRQDIASSALVHR